MRLPRPSAASVPWTCFPRDIPERPRVMWKCVFGSPDAVGEEDDEGLTPLSTAVTAYNTVGIPNDEGEVEQGNREEQRVD
jgi:hypothetical protein